MEITFRARNFTYRARSMDAFSQLRMVRKLSPLFASGIQELVPFFLRAKAEGMETVLNGSMDGVLAALGPLGKAFADLPEEDCQDIIATTLSLCERKGDGDDAWVRIWSDGAKASMFDDIGNDASLMLEIAGKVLWGNLKPFLAGSLSKFNGEARA